MYKKGTRLICKGIELIYVGLDEETNGHMLKKLNGKEVGPISKGYLKAHYKFKDVYESLKNDDRLEEINLFGGK